MAIVHYLLLGLAVVAAGAAGHSNKNVDIIDNIRSFINRISLRGNVTAAFAPTLELIQPQLDELTGDMVDVFEVEGNNGKIILRGSSGPALSAAVGHYFKYYLKCDIYWENGGGYQLETFPKASVDFPIPVDKERIVFMSKERYYQNTCTASYTFAWRDWTSYEQEIDWMAFNGINLPLAFTGQEFVWAALYRGQYGVSEKGLAEFFSGPAFLAWNRMSNMRAYGGPLPAGWIEQQFELQKKILQRYSELGIQPVLPAFNGVVPAEMAALFPSANITRLSKAWCSFPTDYCCPYIVSSTDPLFIEIGSNFLKLQRQLYGDAVADVHTYNCDTFNENTPASNDATYLASSSTAVFNSMRAGDPEAIWLMQAWLFVEDPTFWNDAAIGAYLGGVPDEGMLVLDLTSDEVPVWNKIAANKKKFIWCLLHNYGGSRALYGNLTMMSTSPMQTRVAAPGHFSGTGLTMEAIDHNPIVYEFMNDMAKYGAMETSKLTQDPAAWTEEYVVRRYGLTAPSTSAETKSAAMSAWKILLHNNYLGYVGCHNPTCPRRSIITTRPLFGLVQGQLGHVCVCMCVCEVHDGKSAHDSYPIKNMERLRLLLILYYHGYG